INKGSNIIFQNNKCTGGHGISIGSVASGSTVSNIHITGNTITNNVQALRIKTDADATSGSVSGVIYSGNTATGCTEYGVIIDQSYPDTLGTPKGGVKISGITFTGTNTIAVASSAKGEVEVNCAKGGCTGTWNWAGLKVSGGTSAGSIANADITNFKFIFSQHWEFCLQAQNLHHQLASPESLLYIKTVSSFGARREHLGFGSGFSIPQADLAASASPRRPFLLVWLARGLL
ncbi:Glycosyl hydrolases family 28, partial [Rhizoctonia solani]